MKISLDKVPSVRGRSSDSVEDGCLDLATYEWLLSDTHREVHTTTIKHVVIERSAHGPLLRRHGDGLELHEAVVATNR